MCAQHEPPATFNPPQVRALSGYATSKPEQTRVQFSFLQINMRADHSAQLQFCFKAAGTNASVVVDSFKLVFHDLDNAGQATTVARERIRAGNLSQYKTSEDLTPPVATEVEITQLADGRTQFYSTTQGTGFDNARNPNNLTPLQQSRLRPPLLARLHRSLLDALPGRDGGAVGRGRHRLCAERSAAREPRLCVLEPALTRARASCGGTDEEIFLPVTCKWLARLAINGSARGWPCRVAAFHQARSISADHFRFRPDHACEDFLNARGNGTADVWHPVKLRGCFVEWVDKRGAEGGPHRGPHQVA